MKRTRLGKDGPEISQFGIGAMSFAGIYGNATMEEAHAVLDACREAGVTHIDTAAVYGDGRSEEIIGAWFGKNPGARAGVGNLYSQFSPFGFNGAYYYLRVKYELF